MTDDLDTLDADEEELRTAAALARALESDSAGPDVPQAALETAALLRLSAGRGELSEARRAEIRRELLAALPATPATPKRAGPPRWLLWCLPFASAAAALAFLYVQSSESEPLAQREAGEAARTRSGAPLTAPAQAPAAAAPRGAAAVADDGKPLTLHQVSKGAANLGERARAGDTPQLVTQLGGAARAQRSELLGRLHDAELSRVHAELDRARTPAELEQSQRDLRARLDAIGDELNTDDARHIRQDLFCRLAEAALKLGEPRAALEWTRRGLDLDGPPTPFLAQLSALEGDAWAALGDDDSAAKSYMEAIRVHDALLDESLDGR